MCIRDSDVPTDAGRVRLRHRRRRLRRLHQRHHLRVGRQPDRAARRDARGAQAADGLDLDLAALTPR
eukprot:3159040-Prymnesium_polylepis.1